MYEEICHSNFKKYIVPMFDDPLVKKSRFLLNNQIFLIQYPQELYSSSLSPQEYSNLVNDINKNLRKSRKFIKIFTILSTLHFIILILVFLIISVLFKDYIFESVPIVAGTFSSLLIFPIFIFISYIWFYIKRNRIFYEYNKFFSSRRIRVQFKEFRGFNGSPKLKIYYPPINHSQINNINGILDDNFNYIVDSDTPSSLNQITSNFSSSSPSSSMVSSASSSTSSLNSLVVEPNSSGAIESSFALEPSSNKEFTSVDLDDDGIYSTENYNNILKDFTTISIIPTPPNSSIITSVYKKNSLDSFSEKTPLLGHR
ncbi:expressed protein [Dictyostelium purpureum]|uniref:Expressed protein n=1 Tax=Dictyostelium purpureum TaxID=5786 RepID=F1A342_DICPU|nr:uncharacterized protein DICPUDRAFT_99846 [Dictyostelium purpureum]EGC29385.1 expressed protein [Dictyostelium purpureum]|eukprot:XP_003294086.1 expressed protein [Dictyostelium purpureum]